MKTKEQGISQVISNNQSDYLKVYSFATAWIKTRMKEFTAEDLKTAYLALNEPVRNQNVYGAVFNSLAKEGLLKYKRHEVAKLPAARSRKISVWDSIYFRLKQQNNARRESTLNLFA